MRFSSNLPFLFPCFNTTRVCLIISNNQMIGKMLRDAKNGGQTKKLSMAVLRLQKDLKIYEESEIEFVKLVFPDEEDLQKIEVEIRLSLDT